MTRPEFVDGFECPSCQSRDTVSLSLEKDCVGWCNCGIVWIIKNNDKHSADVELVYSFSMPLGDAIARRIAEIDNRAVPDVMQSNVITLRTRKT